MPDECLLIQDRIETLYCNCWKMNDPSRLSPEASLISQPRSGRLKTPDWKRQYQTAGVENARLENAGLKLFWRKLREKACIATKCYFIRCCSTTAYQTHVVYKWYNVRVPRKVHDVGSFLYATDGQAVVQCLLDYLLSFSAGVQGKRTDSVVWS